LSTEYQAETPVWALPGAALPGLMMAGQKGIAMKYFSTQRPVAPGSFPKPNGNKVVEIHNYNDRIFCEEINREAWGYVVYKKALAEKEAAAYELVPAGTKVFWCVTSSYDDKGRVTAAITDTKEAVSKPQQTYTSTRRNDIYNDWFDSQEEAQKFVEDAKKA